MKKVILLSSFLGLSLWAFSQVGVGAGYLQTISAENWANNTVSSGNQAKIIELPESGFEVSIDYRLKLRNIRIEFYPTLAYSKHEQDISLATEDIRTQMTGLHLYMNSRIYPLDLEGDCDCPTWRKEGPTMEKGLFLQVSTGLSFFNHELSKQDNLSTTSKDTGFHFGAGLGFDLGISDLLTITPIGMLRYYPSLTWNGLENEPAFDFPEEIKAESDLLQYQLGIHIGFHLRN